MTDSAPGADAATTDVAPTLAIPQLCLVALVGASGSGKSTFAARHFGPYEVVSSDRCRGMVSDDEMDQSANRDAFDLLAHIVGARLAAGRLTVVDATNVTPQARRQVVELAKAHDVLPVAIVLDVPESVCLARHRARHDRPFDDAVIRRHCADLRRTARSAKALQREGFRVVHVLHGADEVGSARIVRERLLNDKRDLTGPFDVIGDVHGCGAELGELLTRLGYVIERDEQGRAVDAAHPAGRTAVFVGDLVDRGPDVVGVLRLAMGMTARGHALAVPGNHEAKLVRALRGQQVRVTHGLGETLEQLAGETEEFRGEVERWCYDLVSHLVLDGGRLVVAHAGLIEPYHGRASGRVRSFALYGDTTGETDEYGLPVRYPWAQEYRGRATVLYGHTPTLVPEWVNNTMCLDTGCVFGGSLTALRYPEREVVQVAAHRVWYEPSRPLVPAAPARPDDELRLDDVLGERSVETGVLGRVTVRAEQAAGALEVISRFALQPRQLPYLPPTMTPPTGVAKDPRRPAGPLEHPLDAYADYARAGVRQVICEAKHMGSRAVVLVRREAGEGAVYTRTGRSFFDHEVNRALLHRVSAAAAAAGVWEELATDWVLLDAELLPWSAKAADLVRDQYAAVAAASGASLAAARRVLAAVAARGVDVADLAARIDARAENAAAYAATYQRYCWPTDGLDGVRLAPFQVLAAAGATFETRDHLWHLDVADRLAEADPLFTRTDRLVVDTGDEASTAAGVAWWEALTGAGGEGMVVKPLANLTLSGRDGKQRPVQPGIKVRGREYLRMIYGPDYTEPENLARLVGRSTGRKASLALREYPLSLESLRRHVAGEPLWRVHECVVAVLALESDPVDPRL